MNALVGPSHSVIIIFGFGGSFGSLCNLLVILLLLLLLMTLVFFVDRCPLFVFLVDPGLPRLRLSLCRLALELLIPSLVRLLGLMMVVRLGAAPTNTTAALFAAHCCSGTTLVFGLIDAVEDETFLAVVVGSGDHDDDCCRYYLNNDYFNFN